MARNPTVDRLRACVARGKQTGADVTEARAELKTAVAAEYIRKLLAEAPPLSAERRIRIATILFAPSTVDGGDGAP